MSKRNFLYIKNFIFVIIPALLAYITKDDYTFEVVAGPVFSHDLLVPFKTLLGLTAVLLQACIGGRIIFLNLNRAQQAKYLLNYLKLHKIVALNEIGQALKDEEKNIIKQNLSITRLKKRNMSYIEVKIYLPQRNRFKACLEKISFGMIKAKTLFVENNIKEFGQQHYTGLMFEVYPRQEGLIGQCYAKKSVCIMKDFDPNLDLLNLAPYQRDKLSDIKFYACCPVYLCGKSIKAILVFESRIQIQFDNILDPLFHEKMRGYRNQLELEFPEIFKKVEGD